MAIENLNDLERFVQLEEGQTLADLINSEDKVTINLKEGSFYTNEEKETLIGNYKKDFETSGREKLLKKLRDENELSYEGVKDPAKLIEALTSKIKAQTVEEYGEPNKKIESLNGDLNSLRSQLEQKDAAYNDLMNTINKERENLKIDSVISANIPSNTMIPKEDLMLLFKSKHELSLDDAGNLLVLKNGEVLKDELRNAKKNYCRNFESLD
jgi:predicted RNase H-like nuclease (RuvC/YqgF family)